MDRGRRRKPLSSADQGRVYVDWNSRPMRLPISETSSVRLTGLLGATRR